MFEVICRVEYYRFDDLYQSHSLFKSLISDKNDFWDPGHSGRSAEGGASVAFHFPYSVNLIPILRLQPTVRKHACKVNWRLR